MPCTLPNNTLPYPLLQLRRLELASVRLAQFTPRLAQALSGLTYLSCSGGYGACAMPAALPVDALCGGWASFERVCPACLAA